MINLIKQLLSPYFNMQKVDFRPLEYIEVEQGKPLIIKLNENYLFKTNLMIAAKFIQFNTSKNIILSSLSKLNELENDSISINVAKVACFKNLIRLLYEISKQNYKGFFKKRRYFKYLNNLLINDLQLLQAIFTKVLEYNSALKKKVENLESFAIFPDDVSDMTAGGQRLQDLIKINPKTGEKYFIH